VAWFHRKEAEAAKAGASSAPDGESRKLHGIVTGVEPSGKGTGTVIVRVRAHLPDGSDAQFSEEVANLYQPASGTPEAERLVAVREEMGVGHPGRIPKIQLPVWAGSRVPVRSHREKLSLDLAAVQRQALDDYVARARRPPDTTPAAASISPTKPLGPPWQVPSECPGCGAPVDQAIASQAADPSCPFCREPIPVQPIAGA
jgi:hypothetical protein